MARSFTVNARITAEDRTEAVARAQARLGTLKGEVSKLQADFKSGKISADAYSKSLDTIDREAADLNRTLEASTPKIDGLSNRFSKAATAIKANALKIVASIVALRAAFRQIEESAEQIGQKNALANTLAAQGIAVDEFVGKLKQLSDNQIATNDLILASNRALALGLRAEDLPELLTVAAQRSVDLGISVTQAFNDITTGVGRASPLILDNLGIVIDATKTYGDFAANIGKSVEELTKQEKTLALTQAVIGTVSDTTKEFSERQAELTRNINQGKAAFDNLKSASGQLLGGLVQMVSGGLVATITAFSLAAEAAIKLARGWVALISLIPGLGGALEGVRETLKGLDDAIDSFQQKAAQLAEDLSKGGVASVQFGLGLDSVDTSAVKARRSLDEVASSTEKVEETSEDATEAVEALDEAFGAASVTSAALTAGQRALQAGLAATSQQATQTITELQRLANLAASNPELVFGNRVRDPVSGGLRFFTQPGTRGLGNSIVSPPGGGPSGGTFTTFTPNATILPNGRVTFFGG